MGISTKTGTFTISSSDTVGTNITLTPGFEALAIICWYYGQSSGTDAVTNQTARYGFGVGTSASDRQAEDFRNPRYARGFRIVEHVPYWDDLETKEN